VPESNPFIHVGLTKAASTFLQTFFDACPEIHYPDRMPLCTLLAVRNPFQYDPQAAGEFFRGEIERAHRDGTVAVFSHERLAGNPHSGHFDCVPIAHRLRSLAPRARVLLVLREQTDLLASCYKQYIRIGGVKTLQDYLLAQWDHRVPLFEWTFYQYHRLLECYRDIFGPENLHVLLFEDMVRSPRAFMEDLLVRLGVSSVGEFHPEHVHHPGIADGEIESLRVSNLLTHQKSSIRDAGWNWTGLRGRLARALLRGRLKSQGFGESGDVKRAVGRLFEGRFAQSNARVSEILGRDLSTLGYDVRSPRK